MTRCAACDNHGTVTPRVLLHLGGALPEGWSERYAGTALDPASMFETHAGMQPCPVCRPRAGVVGGLGARGGRVAA